MNESMNQSEIDAMNQSFAILNDRKKRLLENAETIKLKDMVKRIREYSITHTDELQKIAVKKLQDNGIEVFFAEDSKEALNIIYNKIGNEKQVAKSKSNTAGEIGLPEFLESKGIEVIETDLGDRIVQFTPQRKSSHPIGPASHLKMDYIAEIVSKKFKQEVKAEPREILNIIKEDVLKELSRCKVGVTGANSLAAEDGSLIMVHNEGNITLVSMLDTHIIIVGIDKLVRTIEESISVVKLETIYASGKTAPAYINVISSPSKTADIEQIHLKDMYGAKRVVVVLLDNGRNKALKDCPECLLCIGCGSCITSCPIYNVLGYEFGYGRHLGGRGVVFSRFFKDKKICSQAGLYTCTLCGHCTIDCPMEIPINHLIEELRRESVESDICQEPHRKIAGRIRSKGSPFS
jgi:L-lactate utilization protein LutB